jgi:branched-chain amino acid transport system permease protein
MKDAISFLLVGIGAGGFFALLATGIVIAYRGSGVINFAQGAVAMFTAFQFDSARKKGIIQMPWVDILPTKTLNLPVRIKVGPETGVGFIPGLMIALVTAIALGALMHFLVFRPLRNAAPLGKVIGSLGTMLYLQGIALKNFGTDSPQPEVVLPDGVFARVPWVGKPLSREAFWLGVASIMIGALVWSLFRFTKFGLATRAAAGNEKGAVLLGYSPELLSLANWVISSVIAGLAGVLVGSITGALNPVKFSTLVVPALGAALIGRLSSVPLAVLGGLGIGMVQSLATTSIGRKPDLLWLQGGSRDTLPFLVIVAVLILRGRGLPIRGTVEEKKLPLSPYPKRVWQHTLIWGALAIAASLVVSGGRGVKYGLQANWGLAITVSIVTSIIMLSYVVLTGYIGQISVAQMSIAGCAAFGMVRMSSTGAINSMGMPGVKGPGLPWPISALVGIIAAVVIGVLLGLPALRIRGVQLAVVTLAAAVAVQTLMFENDKVTGVTPGFNAEVSSPTFFGLNIGSVGSSGLNDNPWFTVFCVVVLALLCAAVSNLRRSATGRRFLAVRANERAAAAAGVNVMRTKLLAFALSSAIAGVGGVMLAFQQVSVSSSNWVYGFSLAMLAFCYLGGITSVNGALVGGLLFANGLITVVAGHHSKGLVDYTSIIGGAAMIFTAIRNPAGIAPTLQPALQYLGKWLKTARGPQWAKATRAVLPGALVAMGAVSLLLWNKAEEWRNWFLLLVPSAGLFIRGIAKELFHAVKGSLSKGKPGAPGAPAASASPAASSTLAEQGA